MDKRKQPQSEEHRKKIGDAQRGIKRGPLTENWKKSISNAHKRNGLIPPS